MASKTMKFGSHYLPTYVPELDGSVTEFYGRMFAQMEEMDRLNYDHIWVTEHHFAHYKDLKKPGSTKVNGWGDIEAAKKIIEESIARYGK